MGAGEGIAALPYLASRQFQYLVSLVLFLLTVAHSRLGSTHPSFILIVCPIANTKGSNEDVAVLIFSLFCLLFPFIKRGIFK